MKTDILIAGVGGQGQVLASRLIGAAAIDAGLMVRTGETIGMAQRGGCVTSNVRIGGGVKSAAVPYGAADLLIGFELCETARNIPRLKKGGSILLNDRAINPVTVSLGLQSYDAPAMQAYIQTHAGRLIVVDAMRLAAEAGSEKACNVVMLGCAVGAGLLPLPPESFLKALTQLVPEKYLPLNQRAFESGYAFAQTL